MPFAIGAPLQGEDVALARPPIRHANKQENDAVNYNLLLFFNIE
jgi:hypothetical protein